MTINNYTIAVVGDGTSAVNAIDALVHDYKNSGYVLPPLTIHVFGCTHEADVGKGFAYGNIAGPFGNLTEAPDHGDYHPQQKGALRKFIQQENGNDDIIHYVKRAQVGGLHTERFADLRDRLAPENNIEIIYHQGFVTDIDRQEDSYSILADNVSYPGFERVLVAAGDVRSSRFDHTVDLYPHQVFETPYHALPLIGDAEIIVAFGTRSSFVDLVNNAFAQGFSGTIYGVSGSGQTSWQAREDRGLYPVQYLKKEHNFSSVVDIFKALKNELLQARKEINAYVPESLIENLNKTPEKRLPWDFTSKDEYKNRDNVTYHDIAGSVDWESIYEKLPLVERDLFNATLEDFITYNRVNRIVPFDYEIFASHINSGRVQLIRSSFSENGITQNADGRLNLRLDNGSILTADKIVNCAIGPTTADKQRRKHPLLKSLFEKGWIKPKAGTGFDVTPGFAIDLIGIQARSYAFSGIGIETNGRQAVAWAKNVISALAAKLEFTQPPPTRKLAYG